MQRLSMSEESAKQLEQKTILLEDEVESTKQELCVTQQSLALANENCKLASSNLIEMTLKMNSWKTQATDLVGKIFIMEGNVS